MVVLIGHSTLRKPFALIKVDENNTFCQNIQERIQGLKYKVTLRRNVQAFALK